MPESFPRSIFSQNHQPQHPNAIHSNKKQIMTTIQPPAIVVSEQDVESNIQNTNKEQAPSNKTTGLFGIFAGLSFVVGFVLFGSALADLQDDDLTDLERLQVVKDNEQIYYLSNMILYVLFGFAQLGLSLGLAHMASTACPQTSTYSKALGTIWSTLVLSAGMIGNIGAEAALELLSDGDEAAATTLWITIRTLHNSLGGGNEIVGGLWVLLASYCHYSSKPQTGLVDKASLLIGVVAGLAGIVSTVPVLKETTVVIFGVENSLCRSVG
eukprot:Nitzschia sp. Nitz4//scaffold17_size182527//50234//51187//NITZ4_001840-RA/size182527-processed-gene-0.46-mRNA-1//-1//CDS//3329539298//5935//frame0